MAMSEVLEKLEQRIEELVKAYAAAKDRIAELESQVGEFENQAATGQENQDRITVLEEQRESLAERLEKVLANIDEALHSDVACCAIHHNLAVFGPITVVAAMTDLRVGPIATSARHINVPIGFHPDQTTQITCHIRAAMTDLRVAVHRRIRIRDLRQRHQRFSGRLGTGEAGVPGAAGLSALLP